MMTIADANAENFKKWRQECFELFTQMCKAETFEEIELCVKALIRKEVSGRVQAALQKLIHTKDLDYLGVAINLWA